MERAEAAEVLSVKEDTITAVDETALGTEITTRDGAVYVVVPDDAPDGAGRTGLMLREAPNGKPGGWSLPIYTPPRVERSTDADLEAASSIDDDELAGDGVPDGKVDEVLEWAGDVADRARAALAVELDRAKPRKSLVAELEKIVAGAGADALGGEAVAPGAGAELPPAEQVPDPNPDLADDDLADDDLDDDETAAE